MFAFDSAFLSVMRSVISKLAVSLLMALFAVGCRPTATKEELPIISPRPSMPYHDHYQYFVALIPVGWQTREFPDETVRSKVRFQHPAQSRVEIEVIASPTPAPGFSFDDLVAENEGKIAAIKRLAPGATLTIHREKVTEREAVVQRVRGTGTDMLAVVFIEGEILYQLSLYRPSELTSSEPSATFERFLRGFTILDRAKKSPSEAERRLAVVTRYKNLAKAYLERGDASEALKSVEEGLLFDQNNKTLSELRDEIKRAHRAVQGNR